MDAETQTETGNAIAPLLYTPDHIVLETWSSSDAILVLTNGFSPFWCATVDGRHRVAFAYDPPYRAFPVKTGTR